MRRLALALAATAALALSLPLSVPAQARDEIVVVKKGRSYHDGKHVTVIKTDRGMHRGDWRGHHYGQYKNQPARKKVVVMKRNHYN